MSALDGRRVVVVGGSSGIGLGAAQLAAARGANVTILGRSQPKLDGAMKTLPGAAQAIAMDMRAGDAVDRAMAQIGHVDHLVLTAVADELASKAPIAAITDEQIERTFDKLRGFARVIRSAVPRLDPAGSIVLVTGASAVRPPREGFSALAAASASLLGFGRALALELAPVRVNVLMSGIVDTPIHAGDREQVRAWAEKDLPVRRLGQPEDLAHAIELLMTNPYVTAATLTVDGGYSAL